MLARILTFIIIFGANAGLMPIAQAQFRVSTGVHTSSGSCSACDLSDKTMPGMTLRDADFSKSLFNRSNLSGGQFYSSDLSNTHFRKAFLARVSGEHVNFTDSTLRGTTLTEAKFKTSIMTRCDLRGADLTRGEFIKSDFSEANLIRVSGQDANFEGSEFRDAKFDYANLTNAHLDKGRFHRAVFGHAVLTNATLSGADLSWADMSVVQGLKQEQLDTACGNAETQLPLGLSVSYCTQHLSAENMPAYAAASPKLDRRRQVIAARIDRALTHIEKLMANPPEDPDQLRRQLEKAHADMVDARRKVGN